MTIEFVAAPSRSANFGDQGPPTVGIEFYSSAELLGVIPSTPPTIGNFAPPVGTPLTRSASVAFDAVDDLLLRRVVVMVVLGAEVFVAHDGDTFCGAFAGSDRAVIAGGWRYTIRRNGGWVDPPVFKLLAIDTFGNEAT